MAFMRRRRRTGSGGGGGARAARRGGRLLASLVTLVMLLVVSVIVVAILLVLLEANSSNMLVKAVLDAAKFLVGPFESIFSLKSHKAEIGVNYGLAAVIYFIVGSLIARLLRR